MARPTPTSTGAWHVAASYATPSYYFDPGFASAIANLTRSRGPNATLLDVGAGIGRYVRFYRAQGIDASGLDGLTDRLQRLGPAATDFLTGFADFTTTYGSRGPNEWELRSRTWETHPELPLALVDRMRFSPDSDDPSTTRAAAHQRSGEALELLQSMVADNEEAAGTLAIAVPAARAWIPAREQCKATIVRIIHEVRLAERALRELRRAPQLRRPRRRREALVAFRACTVPGKRYHHP